MNNVSRWAIVCGLLAMNLVALSFAGEKLDKDTLETLIKGNTVEGKKIKWKSTYKMYLDPSGEFRRIDSNNNNEGGVWRVESDGTLCMTGRKENCRAIKQRSDGGYDVYSDRGQVVWTMDKFSPGDPYNLMPK